MTMETKPTPKGNEPLCGIMIYFPVGKTTDVMGIMSDIEGILSDIPMVKTDLRITKVKGNGGNMEHI